MRSLVLTLSTAALLSTSACSSVNVYKDPVEQLASGTTNMRVAIQTLGDEVNDLDVQKKTWEAASKSLKFDDKLKGHLMAPQVPQEYIRARAAGLLMIERFAAQMLRAVNSTSGELASMQVVALATDVEKLAEAFGAGNAKAYATPIGGLAKVIIDLYSERAREKILAQGIEKGAPAVKALLVVLKSDFGPKSDINLDIVKLDQLKSNKDELVAAYIKHLDWESSLSESQKTALPLVQARQAMLQKLIATQKLINMASASTDQVYLTLVSLDESLDALVSVMKSERKDDATLKTLTEKLVSFSSKTVTLLDSVHAIKTAALASESK